MTVDLDHADVQRIVGGDDVDYQWLEVVIVREIVRRGGVPLQRGPEFCLAISEALGRGRQWARCPWGLLCGDRYQGINSPRPVDSVELQIDRGHPAVTDIL